MAVAVTDADRFGSGESAVKVNKPLLALPALPRFARVGDTFEAGVVVHTYGPATGEVTVTAEAQGARSWPAPPSSKVRRDGAGAQGGALRLHRRVRRARATFTFRVKRGEDRTRCEEKIQVELPVALEAVATYGDTTDQRVEGVRLRRAACARAWAAWR